jgi:hypothetical protein
MSEEELFTVLKDVDVNYDGKLSFDEFCGAFAHVPEWDRLFEVIFTSFLPTCILVCGRSSFGSL